MEDPVASRTDLTSELTSELRERAEHVRDRAEEMRGRAEDLRPAVRRTEIGALSIIRDLLGVLLVVPRLVVRLLGSVADAVDSAAERGGVLAERGREAIDALPEARSTRRRRRLKGVLWVAGGFAAGFVAGWLVAQRQTEELMAEVRAVDDLADDASPTEVRAEKPSDDGSAEQTTTNGGRRRATATSD